MKDNPPRVSCKYGTHEPSRDGPTRKSRYIVDESGEMIECTGKYCQSCTTGLIADCVALCCCPYALVDLFTFAFVKVPWMIGRRCLEKVQKKKKKLEWNRKCNKSSSIASEGDNMRMVKKDEKLRRTEEEISEIEAGFIEEEQMARFSAKLETEKVWLEMYQVGHLGFGRVSFTGVQL